MSDASRGKTFDVFSRRRFIVNGSIALSALTAGLYSFEQPISSQSSTPQNGHRRVLHIIGHSHIDAAWLWPWRDGSNTVLTTFRSALDRMKETPDFRYCHSSSAHYAWVERPDPPMFDEI